MSVDLTWPAALAIQALTIKADAPRQEQVSPYTGQSRVIYTGAPRLVVSWKNAASAGQDDGILQHLMATWNAAATVRAALGLAPLDQAVKDLAPGVLLALTVLSTGVATETLHTGPTKTASSLLSSALRMHDGGGLLRVSEGDVSDGTLTGEARRMQITRSNDGTLLVVPIIPGTWIAAPPAARGDRGTILLRPLGQSEARLSPRDTGNYPFSGMEILGD